MTLPLPRPPSPSSGSSTCRQTKPATSNGKWFDWFWRQSMQISRSTPASSRLQPLQTLHCCSNWEVGVATPCEDADTLTMRLGDVADLESTSNLISSIGRKAFAISLELRDSRVNIKKEACRWTRTSMLVISSKWRARCKSMWHHLQGSSFQVACWQALGTTSHYWACLRRTRSAGPCVQGLPSSMCDVSCSEVGRCLHVDLALTSAWQIC